MCPRPLRVVIADRPGAARTALASLVGDDPRLSLVGLAGSLDELLDIAPGRADVILLDDRLLRDGQSPVRAMGTRVVMTGVDDDPAYAARARRVGASTWVRKDMADEVLAALLPPMPVVEHAA